MNWRRCMSSTKKSSRADDVNPTVFTALDLEFNQPSGKIIQIGACVGDVISGLIFERLRIYVLIDEPISPEITALTNITQAQHDELGIPLVEAYKQVAAAHMRHKAFTNALSWGGDDTTYLQEHLIPALMEHSQIGFTRS